MTTYQLASYVKDLYDLPANQNGPFDIVLRERQDHGVNVGIVEDYDKTIFVFRGSVTPEDWARDSISCIPDEKNGMTFPLGFDLGMEEAFRNLRYFLKNAKTFYVTGHSLGAAHAAIFISLVSKSSGLLAERVLLMGCPNLSISGEMESPRILSFKNESDFVCDVPPAPWGPLFPLTKIEGGHDAIPSLFMFHHIDYYLAGIKKWEESQASKT